MRVSSIGNIYTKTNLLQAKRSKESEPVVNKNDSANSAIPFKGKFGQIVGGTIGTGVVLAASFITIPVAACLAGAGLISGMLGGDIAEDYINKEGDFKEKDKDKEKSTSGK